MILSNQFISGIALTEVIVHNKGEDLRFQIQNHEEELTIIEDMMTGWPSKLS